MAEWRTMPFSDAVVVNPPVHLKRGEAYPFVAMADVEPTRRSIHSPGEREFRGGGARFENGDTLMARITPCLENGKIGRYQSARASRVAHGSTEFIVIRGRGGITGDEFAYYLTQSKGVRDYAISQMSGTSGRQRVPTQSLDHLHVRVPGLAQQFAIAQTLGTLDDKIELNSRMNGTLESMARAVFKDWFVDFGPTRAKAEGRGPYLAPELWGLFPDSLDDEGKPVGWSYGPMTAIAEVNPESWSRKNAPEDIEYVDLANTKWGTIQATRRFRWQDAPSRAKRVLRPGDTIVGTVRPGNGSFAFIGDSGLTGSTGFAVLRPRQSQCAELVFLSATAPENIERLANLADGAAYPAVRPQVVGATEVALCEDAVVTGFSALVSPYLDRIESNKRENRTLARIRDLLLPRLMSGEIRLREAEQAVEAAA